MTASAVLEGGPEARVERAFPALDGLRFLAATAIVVTHATFWAGAYAPAGLGRAFSRLEVGVPVFFVLSGFLLTRPFLLAAVRGLPGPRPAAYLWRRGLRILPAYWLLVVVALTVFPPARGSAPGTWWRFLTLTQLYTPGGFGDGLTQTWSLCTEALFYLVLPLAAVGLVRLVRRNIGRPRRALIALACAAVVGPVWTALSATHLYLPVPVNLWLPSYADWFAAGIALALLTVAPPSWRPARAAADLAASPATCWCAAAALFWIVSGPLAGPTNLMGPTTAAEAVVRHLLYLSIAVLAVLPLVLGDQRVGLGRRFLSAPPMRFLGELSYGLFLFHNVVLEGGYALLGLPEFGGNVVAVVCATEVAGLAAALLCYLLVERPVRRWRGLVPERRAPSPEPSAATTAAPSAPSTRT